MKPLIGFLTGGHEKIKSFYWRKGKLVGDQCFIADNYLETTHSPQKWLLSTGIDGYI